MAKRLKIKLERANVSNSINVLESIWDGHAAGLTWSEAAGQVVAEQALQRYQVHLAAAFARYGVVLEPGEQITVPVLLRVINEKTGLNVDNLTPDGVALAVDTVLAGRVSAALGVEVASVQNLDGLKQNLIDAAKQAVISGRATKLISRGMITKIRAMKAFKDAGVNEEKERLAVMNRAHQKKYRRTHKEVWTGSPGDPGFDQDMYGYRRDN